MKAVVIAFMLLFTSLIPSDNVGKHPPALPLELKKYPPLRSMIQRCSKNACEGVELVSSVKQVGDKWEYTYVLKNTGKKKTWLVASSVVDMASGWHTGSREVSHFYRLKPGKSATIKLVDKDLPAECTGIISCFDKNRHEGIKDWYKERGVTITGVKPAYYYQMGSSANGWIPKGLLPKKGE